MQPIPSSVVSKKDKKKAKKKELQETQGEKRAPMVSTHKIWVLFSVYLCCLLSDMFVFPPTGR